MATVDTKFLRRFQLHVVSKLLSEPLLQYVSIASMLNQVQLQPTQRVAPHAAGRNGKIGSGILVNLPVVIPSQDLDVAGAQMAPEIYVDILNEDNMALVLSNGSRLTAEDVLIITWMLLNQYLNQDISSGNWYVAGAEPIEDKKGAYGYRLILRCRMAQPEPAKVANPIITFAGGNCTITCATEGVTIYYTTDESFPGPYTANQRDPANTSTVYSGAFAVASGTIVCATAFILNQSTTIGSDLWSSTAP